VIFCTKKCHKSLENSLGLTNDKTRVNWDKDGKNGPTDPNHSESIIVRWLMEEGNYSKYRGGNKNNGKRKIGFCQHLSRAIAEAGVVCVRTPQQVQAKISYIESSFRSAHEFANTTTGIGIMERDEENGTKTFRELMMRKFRYYYDLLEVMGDRASAGPKVRMLLFFPF